LEEFSFVLEGSTFPIHPRIESSCTTGIQTTQVAEMAKQQDRKKWLRDPGLDSDGLALKVIFGQEKV